MSAKCNSCESWNTEWNRYCGVWALECRSCSKVLETHKESQEETDRYWEEQS